MSTIIWETLIIGAGTYLFRALSFSWGSRVKWSEWTTQWLSYVTPAVLGALLGPLLFMPDGHWMPLLHNPAALAAIPTALVAWSTRHLLWTVAAGICCFAILHYIM